MGKISKARLEKYRKLAEKDLWDMEHEGFQRFFSRARAENVKLISNNFSTQGMFRAPHRKDLEGVDLAIVGVPLDLGVPNPRPGTRLGPEAVRYWSKDRNMVNYHTEVVPFDLCSIIDWGDVEFDQDAYNLNACIEQLIETYNVFRQNNVSPPDHRGGTHDHLCHFKCLRKRGAFGGYSSGCPWRYGGYVWRRKGQ